jgi:hypothetical protein
MISSQAKKKLENRLDLGTARKLLKKLGRLSIEFSLNKQLPPHSFVPDDTFHKIFYTLQENDTAHGLL